MKYYWVAQVVSCRPLTAYTGYAPRSVTVGFVLKYVVIVQVFVQVIRFSPVSIIPPLLSILISPAGWTTGQSDVAVRRQSHPIDMNNNILFRHSTGDAKENHDNRARITRNLTKILTDDLPNKLNSKGLPQLFICIRMDKPLGFVISQFVVSTSWGRSSSKCYLRIQSVPQTEHHTSPLQRSTG
jgi:hypothetical protein